MISVSKEQLSDEEFKTVIQSRGFQKMLLYQRLADGIEVLQTHDLLYESMVHSITERHSDIDSEDVTREVLDHLEREVARYTEPLVASDADGSHQSQDKDIVLTDAVTTPEESETNPEKTVQEYLENRLEETNELNLKANEIASDLGLASTHVGGILGQWRNAENSPFAITASESASSGNVWTITTAD
ncbi:hypothetical protein [Salinibaculum rarum]|uniref:hypothetical protein n=1 Tax=Salinibaculum rarum TaxID=3058903 RepID=UPI00265EC689|nr:hypothetical protein [Salinibaculum sp. KK48]